MNNIDNQYINLLKDILENGTKKTDRTGTGTISVFGRQLRHNMRQGFPLITTKKMAFKTMVIELLWFLKGDTNIKFLVDNGCNIWNGDAYKNYAKKIRLDYSTDEPKYEDGFDCIYKSVTGTILECIGSKYSLYASPFTMDEFIDKIKNNEKFAQKWGDLGLIYGSEWRKWGEWSSIDEPKIVLKEGIDQISQLISDLMDNPDSRRLMVTAWNPSNSKKQVLPPCHYGFQVYTRELTYEERYDIWFENNYETGMEPNYDNVPNFDDETWVPTPSRSISLMWNQRSVDTALGLPFNISSYSLLLIMLAKKVNMVPDEIICNLGDCHIYLDHIDGVNKQIKRKSYKLPNVTISDRPVNDISEYTFDDIKLENYVSHPKIFFPLSN